MINKEAFAELRKDLEQFDIKREEIIKLSRSALKLSKAAIYSLHRNDFDDAEKKLSTAKEEINSIKGSFSDPRLQGIGAFREALEEFVEASCYFEFLKNRKLPTPKDLEVDSDSYLCGICDLVGELVRKAMNAVLEDDNKTADEIRKFVSDLYAELLLFDFRNTPVRRKFDAIKYGLEKLEQLAVNVKLK
jgi:translin